MAKRRTLSEDVTALKEKVKSMSTTSEASGGNSAIRSLKKHLKRTQRKIRSQKRLEERMKAKQAPPAG